MKIRFALWTTALLAFSSASTPAATLYVDLNSTNPMAPYADWSTAATNIQDAIDASTDGDLIFVTNGVYATGGRVANGYALTNRVVIDKAVTVQSVNGPAVTLIQGYQMPSTLNGSNAVRCVYMVGNATLSGFTLTGGATSNLFDILYPEDQSGGGVWCESSNAIISNCVITANSCNWYGAGVCGGTLDHCQIIDNTNFGSSLSSGGGAAFSTLFNSTVEGNSTWNYGGGVRSCALSNCTLTGNSGDGAYYSTLDDCTVSNNIEDGADFSTLNHCLLCNNQGGQCGGAYDCTLNYCVVSNNVSAYGSGGIFDDVMLTNAFGVSNFIVGNTATNVNRPGGGVYLAGIKANLNGWSFISNSATGDGGGLYAPGTTLNNCTFIGNSSGGNGGGFNGAGVNGAYASNCTFIGNVAGDNGGGAYSAALTNCYVSGNKAGGGVYVIGDNGDGGGVYGFTYNCVINDNVAAVNGGGVYGGINNCAFTNNSAMNGGGAYAVGSSYSGFTNCVFWANSATNNGGGIVMGAFQNLDHCIIVSNYAGITGGGVAGQRGFSPADALSYCIVSNNTAGNDGGGTYDTTIANCLLSGNSAAYGGGAFSDIPNFAALGCTIADNWAVNSGGGFYWTVIPFGGLSSPGAITNCIIYDNSAPTNMNYPPKNFSGAYYCCTIPLPLAARGQYNITNDPAFVNPTAGDFHLQSNSPCINSGNNTYVTSATDLDGNPRIAGGTVDIGAYEYQTPVSKISYAWLQQYGLPITTNIDSSDLDDTGFNVFQDWIAGLNPTNALSVLAMLAPVPTNNPSGLVVRWESVNNRTYFLQSSTNLGMQPAFSTIQSNIVGQPNLTSFMDTNAIGNGPYFYRVGVQQ